MEILKVENLRKEYGEGNSKVIALDGVDLSIEMQGRVGPENQLSYTSQEEQIVQAVEKFTQMATTSQSIHQRNQPYFEGEKQALSTNFII